MSVVATKKTFGEMLDDLVSGPIEIDHTSQRPLNVDANIHEHR
jgi:hypothetical protein